MDLNSPLRELSGIGEKTEKKLQKLGVYTVSDILLNFPRGYVKYKEVTSLKDIVEALEKHQAEPLNYDNPLNEPVAILGMLKTPAVNKTFYKNGGKKNITLATIFTDWGSFEAVWFNTPYVKNQLSMELPFVFYGKINTEGGHKFKMDQPAIFVPEEYEVKRQSLQPVYSLTFGVTNNLMQKTVKEALRMASFREDYLPDIFIQKRNLVPLSKATEVMHFPDDFEQLTKARSRIVYDEFFRFLLQMYMQKEDENIILNSFKIESVNYYEKALKNLPFELTDGQKKVLEEIRSDFDGEYVCERLLQGDVGSGKTIIAFLLMLIMAEQGYQTAIMAPTEVLAVQHFETFKKYMSDFELPFDAVLLVGSMTAAEKRRVYKRIEEEDSLFIIGTHALIQEKVNYKNLSFVVTDEQHRFGVKQRRTFSEKGIDPFVLVMSATPIPRTLALILYGDMKLSVISDVPARRLPIKNAVIKKNKRKTAYTFIAKEVKAGHQAYVICPLVESSEKTEAENVVEYTEKLKDYYGDSISIGLLHGKMPAKEKNAVMEAFAKKELDVLVSTTVIEVGINVPNATVMVIEDANRFGLAQLHQLRGRVGRGDAQSYCIFIDGTEGEKTSKRLEILSESNDGFYIASEDLKLRGPGDFYGIRQSGDFGFEIADIYQDAEEMQEASEDVQELLQMREDEPEILISVLERINKNSGTFYTNL